MIKIINKNKFKIIFNVNYDTFINQMKKKQFVLNFINILKQIPYLYYVIQTPCLQNNRNKFFEFVIINTPGLSEIKIDNNVYKKYFKNTEMVTSFPNLTGDATLIVPNILKNIDKKVYLNIQTFTNGAPINQQIILWKKVFSEINNCKHKCFLNTHGFGYGWLHIRIDKYPKYYIHKEYIIC
jgi:hypothetical protein